ncbi:MAG: CPBP family intramembrane metalloprotease [Anaerolineae bacterium]|nr:CPBP family intramembrane metalloprotease [Anaerolineae bacterium]
MSIEFVILIVVLAALVGTARLARQSDNQPAARRRFLLAWAAILCGFVGYVLLSFVALYSLPDSPLTITLPRGMLALGIAAASALYLWFFVAHQPFRARLIRFLPSPPSPATPATGEHWPIQFKGADPTRNAHAFGLGIAQLMLVQTLIDFILAGGQAGLSLEPLEQQDVVSAAALTALLLLVLAFAAVGLWQDRTPGQALARVGITRPQLNEVVMGGGVAIGLLAFQFFAGAVWMLLVSQKAFEQQTQLSQAIAGSVTTVSGALLVAIFSSIGEEIAFRGALQPIVGLWPTAILFALTHIQYQFTPAVVIILVVGLAFGWTRRHFGTVSAIVAHFCYNFTLLLMAVLASQLTELVGLLP